MSNNSTQTVFDLFGFSCGGIVNLITLVIVSIFSVAWGYYKRKYLLETATAKTTLASAPVNEELLKIILQNIQNPSKTNERSSTQHIGPDTT